MRAKLVLVAVLLAALVIDASAAEKIRKKGKGRKHMRTTESPDMTDTEENEMVLQQLEDSEKNDESKYEAAERLRLKEMARDVKEGVVHKRPDTNELFEDACTKIHCSAGRICELTEEGEAGCICIRECPYEVDDRRKVCTNHNETWGSDCEVHRHRCLCMTGQEGCKGSQYSHVQVDYYGQCREMPECAVDEMADFPRRMRDWLFNIMRDLADRKELSEYYLKMEREAESNLTRRWTNAAIWKWCDLDALDNDRFVSRHELFPIRAPLMSLEHCIGPFLNSCDTDDDHRITLSEWGKCLQLDDDELDHRCDDFNEANGE